MDGIKHFQLHITVDAGTGIPVGISTVVTATHGNDILLA